MVINIAVSSGRYREDRSWDIFSFCLFSKKTIGGGDGWGRGAEGGGGSTKALMHSQTKPVER